MPAVIAVRAGKSHCPMQAIAESRIFLSHSGRDAALSISTQETVERSFASLGRTVTVFNTSTPHDRFRTLESYIAPGTVWRREVVAYEKQLREYLRKHLTESSAYLLLVTPLSLAADSKWIRYEIDMARSIAQHRKTHFFFPCVAHGVMLHQLPVGATKFQGLSLKDPTWIEQLAKLVIPP